MEFIEAPAFTRHLSNYLIDDDYRELQAKLGANPEFGDLMPGTGGFRKFALGGRAARQRPQRRAAHYLFFKSDCQIWLMALYDKKEASELKAKEKKALKASIENELAAHTARRETGMHRLGRIR